MQDELRDSCTTPRNRSARRTSRAGVRACAAYFEDHGCAFQEVAQQNDFGKDAYVDLPDTNHTVGHCVALQIKSGPSYRRRDGTYVIPIGKHAITWRESTVPLFGVVFDPEHQTLHWVDLTRHLRENRHLEKGSIVASEALTDETFSAFCMAVGMYRQGAADSLFLNLLSDEPARQLEALQDAWALGRRDVRYLLLCRRLLLELSLPATRYCIWRLSHAASHPDIFYTDENWLPTTIQKRLRLAFRWSSDELAHMFHAVDPEEWGRGTLGQCLDMLLARDPQFQKEIPKAIELLLNAQRVEAAARLIVVALTYVEDPLALLRSNCAQFPQLARQEWLQELELVLQEENQFSLY